MLLVERERPACKRTEARQEDPVTADRVTADRAASQGSWSPAGRTAPWAPPPSTGFPLPEALRWKPLAGDALVDRLRITGRPRPPADPQLAARLRLAVEQGSEGTARSGCVPFLMVTKGRLSRALACDVHHIGAEFGERAPSMAMACGALVDVLFRQLVTVGSIGEALSDGLDALSVDDRQRSLVAWIEGLSESHRRELGAEVERQAEGLRSRWPTLDPTWLPRTQETMRARLAGGLIELSARVDLAIGRPPTDAASVAIVEVKSGARHPDHRADLHFYALVETIRSGAPPFVVATYYTRTGELDVDPVTEELLVTAARRTRAGIESLRRTAAGAEPARGPNALCAACFAVPESDVTGTWPGAAPGPADDVVRTASAAGLR